MAEVVDIQTLGVQRKASQAKDEIGLWTKSDSGIPGKKNIAEVTSDSQINRNRVPSQRTQMNQSTNEQRIEKESQSVLLKRSSDVNANEVEEEEHNVHQSQDKMSDSQELCTDRSQDENNGGVNSIKADNPEENVMMINTTTLKTKVTDKIKEKKKRMKEDEEGEDDDDRTMSKSSTYSVNYPSFSRESSVTLPYDVASIEGILFSTSRL